MNPIPVHTPTAHSSNRWKRKRTKFQTLEKKYAARSRRWKKVRPVFQSLEDVAGRGWREGGFREAGFCGGQWCWGSWGLWGALLPMIQAVLKGYSAGSKMTQ